MVATPHTPVFDFSVLRDLRKREGLTIQEVSDRAGISAAVISKLERNQSACELETLHRLARVFALTASDLISLAESRVAQLTKARQYTSHQFKFSRIDYANAQCFFAEAPAGADLSRPDVHGDDLEICWVLSGSIQIALPRETHLLKAGDAIQFDGVEAHTYKAKSDSRLVLIHLKKDKRF